MTDLTAPPSLPQQYAAFRAQADDEAAYQQEAARVQALMPKPEGAPEPPKESEQPKPQEAAQQPQAKPQTERPPEHEAAIQREAARLSQPPFDASRFENPQQTLRDQAARNLGLPVDQEIQKLREQAAAENLPKVKAVATDIWQGIVQSPRAVYSGAHNAVQSLFDGFHSLTGWINDKTNWGDLYFDTRAGHPLVSIRSADEMRQLDSGPVQVPLKWGGQEFSTTGKLIAGTSQFLTGMAFAGSEMKALGLPSQLSGWAGRGYTAAKGFLAQFQAFDGAQGRLSDLVQSVPSLRNPVTEFLASKPDDDEAVGRLKSAIEGTALGQVVDGVVHGLRMLRSAYAARQGAQAIIDHVEANTAPPPSSAGLDALGDSKATPDSPLTEVVKKGEAQTAKVSNAKMAVDASGLRPKDVTAMGEPAGPGELAGPESPGATAAQAKEPGIYVNFNRIDTPDDIKRAISELAGSFKDDINGARRGVQSFEQTKLGASAVDAWQVLMDRRVGQPLNDYESVAVRQLWATSAAKTMELAQIASETPSPENLFAFRKMLTAHAAIQEQVIAARTETARALSSWRIPAGESSARLESMTQALSGEAGLRGGLETALEMAKRVQAIANAGDVTALGRFAEKSALARTRDALLEAWTNGLLTGPMTHVKVGLSNAATVALRIAERSVAGRISQLLGDESGVQVGEAAAQYAGLMGGLKDSLRYIGKLANSTLEADGSLDGKFKLPPLENDPLSKAIKAGAQGEYSMNMNGLSEAGQNSGAISSVALGISNSGWLGQAIDYAGQLIRTPGKALTAEHDFFRSLGYRMELHALATRQAIEEFHGGQITEDAIGSRIGEIIDNPPPNVHIGAVDGMLYQTFTDAPGKLAEMIGNLRNEFPAVRVILPFYKIPSRILSFTFERSPLAPLMSTFRQNIAAGGARQSMALAQMGLGTAAMLATADAVMSGQVTGSGPVEHGQRAAMENEGWQPYSMKVGDKWVQYNKLETVGSSMAMAADAIEAIRNFQTGVNGDDPDVTNLAFATTLAIAQDITSKSYLQGLSNFFETMASPKTQGNRMLQSLAGSTVPAGLAAFDRVSDPYKRTVYDMISAIQARTPGASEGLPPARNLWGEPIKSASGMGAAYDMFVPFATREPSNEPIDKELLRLGVNVSKPPSRASFDGATIDLHKQPELYSRYQELAGNGYKSPAFGNLGLKDALNSIVSGKDPYSIVYQMRSDGPDGGKAEMIKDIVREYRDGAKQQLLTEYPALRAQVDQKREAQQALRMPVAQ